MFAQSFVEALDELKGTTPFKHRLKQTGNSFIKEVDAFLDSVYEKGGSDRQLIDIIEHCQQAIDKAIDDDVAVID